VEGDGLVVSQDTKSTYTVAQYDAIFSIGDRRNEVWITLDKHDWDL